MIWTDDGSLELIKNEDSFGIFYDMGLGKTALLLGLIDHKFFNENVKKVLIITPKKVSLSTWQNEIKKWDNFNYMMDIVQLIDKGPDERITKLRDTGEFSIHIICSALIPWLYGEYEEKISKSGKKYNVFHPNVERPDYDMIIVDECSQFKSAKSNRFKALKGINASKKGAPMKLFLLSGTPFSNIRYVEDQYGDYYVSVEELYYLFFFLGIYVKSAYEFEKEFMYTTRWDQFKLRTRPDIYKALDEALELRSIRRKLQLSIKKNEYKVYCEIDQERMDMLEDHYAVLTENFQTITAANRAVMINKALQLSNGFIYDEFKNAHRLNTYKIDLLKDILSVVDGNVVIYYNFKEDRELLLSSFDGIKEYTVENEAEWNKGNIPYLLLSPFSEKYGINIQFGGHTIIWFGLIWSGESYLQANGRLYRRGQSHDVDIYYLLGKGSYDNFVYDVLVSKTKAIGSFIDIVKKH